MNEGDLVSREGRLAVILESYKFQRSGKVYKVIFLDNGVAKYVMHKNLEVISESR